MNIIVSGAVERLHSDCSCDLPAVTTISGGKLGRPTTVALLVRFLLDKRHHHRLIIDPAVRNARAIRCYQSVGFRRVAIMQQYERGADGVFHDGLLMELIATDLAPQSPQ